MKLFMVRYMGYNMNDGGEYLSIGDYVEDVTIRETKDKYPYTILSVSEIKEIDGYKIILEKI